jgi:hypothetical protein
MANAIDAGIRLTAPYGKSVSPRQMRQRDAAMREIALARARDAIATLPGKGGSASIARRKMRAGEG